MAKLFIFDLGKVLVDFDFAVALKRLKAIGPVNELKTYGLFRTSDLAVRWDKGEVSPEEFFKILQKELGVTVSMEEFIPIWNNIFSENSDMIRLALSLSKKARVVLLSNTNRWHADYLKKNYPWMNNFYRLIFSCDVRLLKPDPEIFKLALKEAQAAPQDTLYIDDLPENVEAARKMGIDSIQFKGYSALIKEMERRNAGEETVFRQNREKRKVP